MFNKIQKQKFANFLAALATVSLLAGCGGGEEGPAPATEPTSSGPGLVGCIILIFVTGECSTSGSSSSTTSPSPTPTSPVPVTGTGSVTPVNTGSGLRLHRHDEFEINDDTASANIPIFSTRSPTYPKIGWVAVGSVDDVSDFKDVYAFTPSQTTEYFLGLCPPEGTTCESTGIDTLTVFFRLLDQDGSVLLTSQADLENGNKHYLSLDAGVLYYVEVNAGDAMGATIDYRLFVYERP